jgi:hypothetical protein
VLLEQGHLGGYDGLRKTEYGGGGHLLGNVQFENRERNRRITLSLLPKSVG